MPVSSAAAAAPWGLKFARTEQPPRMSGRKALRSAIRAGVRWPSAPAPPAPPASRPSLEQELIRARLGGGRK